MAASIAVGVVGLAIGNAFTPTLGFATRVVSVTVLIFFLFIGIVFWLASLAGKHGHGEELAHEPAPALPPQPGPAALPPGGAHPLPAPAAEADLS